MKSVEQKQRADAAHGILSGESPVNVDKSAVDRPWEGSFLGYTSWLAGNCAWEWCLHVNAGAANDQGEVELSDEFIAHERLPDDAGLRNAYQRRTIGKSSHEQNRQLATPAPGLAGELGTIHAWHGEIDNHHMHG